MRGRKLLPVRQNVSGWGGTIKKESPNEGTETNKPRYQLTNYAADIKKESPNEGTETFFMTAGLIIPFVSACIKKESPNEGTETVINVPCYVLLTTL